MGIFDLFRGKAQADSLERLENRPLLQAMEAVARDDSPETRTRLYRTFLDGILIIPTPEAPAGLKPGPFVTTGNESFQFPLLQEARGKKLIPVFSDLEALRNWDPNTPYIGLNSIALFKTVLGTEAEEIRINPFDPIRKMIRPGGTLTRREFQLLAERQIPEATASRRTGIQPGERILIGIPAEEPPKVVLDALVVTAGSIEDINALFLFQIGSQQNGKWSFQKVIGVQLLHDLNDPQKREIIARLSKSIQPLLRADEFLDFMVLQGALEQQVMTSGKLLYEIAP